MTDIRADDAAPGDDDDRLPWLEAVEEDDEAEGPSPLKMVVAVLIGLVAIGLVVGGIYWLSERQPSSGEPELITAEAGDYKERPKDPGGMQVEGTGDTAFAASEGVAPKGTINVDAVPEAPVTEVQPTAKPTPAPTPAPTPTPKAAEAATPAPAPAAASSGGATIQLGAFSSQASAGNAWKALSGRFKYLEPLSHSVIPVTVGGKTLYRLRASGPNAANLCARLRVAGETCVTVN